MKKIKLMCDITSLLIIGIFIFLYFSYNKKISNEITKLQIPVAVYDIEEGYIIRTDMITYISVSSDEIDENTYIIKNDIIGKISSKDILQGEHFTVNNIK